MLTVIQNDPDVPLGSYADQLTASGEEFNIVELYAGERLSGDLLASNGIIILGGTMGVYDTDSYPYLLDLKNYIRQGISRRIPMLGICLGGQLMAEALGAEISSGIHRECGTYSVELAPEAAKDPLFAGISNPFITFQWHNDSFNLPDGANLLAWSQNCPCQAFRQDNNWGIQFHPEINAHIIEKWCELGSGERALLPVEVDRIITDYRENIAGYTNASSLLIHNFITITHSCKYN
ncbi:putative glutamine amidotransferase-like protein YfeJ [Geobacter sp. OR-1]|uniref:type 1 glutamine amidotransferase n=1 Tax=Geobacter sp. OR-1 TaxID=1266765 RepID=UPI0005436025|nr:type 1 glutamine amidotransferase [Geobacter sp. OR-1]GAM11655.1 putative glutamine amidotransferase-like protein YfeJ [Geobacter sp. OR-1]